MWNEKIKAGVLGMTVLGVTACGTPNQPSTASIPTTSTATVASGYGTVQSIQVVQQRASGMGLGTAAGAVVGGLLGNQVGSGSGRTAATVAGAAGGALAGNSIERNRAGASQAYQVTLRMDDGSLQTLTQDSAPNLQIGDRVRVSNGAIVERIVR